MLEKNWSGKTEVVGTGKADVNGRAQIMAIGETRKQAIYISLTSYNSGQRLPGYKPLTHSSQSERPHEKPEQWSPFF